MHADVLAGCAIVQKRRSLLVRHRRTCGYKELPHGNSAVAAQVSGDLQERSNKAPERRLVVRDARHRENDAGQSDRRRVRRESDQHQGVSRSILNYFTKWILVSIFGSLLVEL